MIKFRVKELGGFTVVHFELNEEIRPSILRNLNPPEVKGTKGVVLSGRGPIWLYGFLVHFYHYTRWVATYDPRLGGAVIIESHWPGVHPGDVVKLNLEEVLRNV
ncbi:CRISPR-associated ring nuclease Crn3/Csx3 [Pyrococcus yayanosii]|uniref:CRISPR-associated protein, Csx3 family n=1 Tax=Pyrococcus yayanosii (strain CH1 / JCM 16557) TaxID=529709 RepID=F8AJ05_PYRYC|nr:CRISPR-associated ring nuclease Crn3/Csx3 [Pyrococcus yayanosii]AEH24487.1 CRISPR-associated protein, Csx3 family [Pyrococcus yayanosii CH1]